MRVLLLGFLAFFLPLVADTQSRIYGIFTVAAVRDSNLMMDTSGIVAKLFVDTGDSVSASQPLLSLSNEDRIENLNMQQAQLEGAKEQYLFAKKQYERYKRSGNAIDKNSLDQNYSNLKNAESAYNNLQHSLKLQSELLRRTTLVAPFDGVIAARNIELGDGVGANQTKLFRLISHEKKLVIQFDSKHLAFVKEGSTYRYRIDGRGDELEARIYKIYPAIDSATRRVTAEALAPDSLLPGLFGDGYILSD